MTEDYENTELQAMKNKNQKAVESYKITVSIKDASIRVFKSIIIRLGYPGFVSILLEKNKKTMLMVPCSENDLLSFKVPQNNLDSLRWDFRICSKSFVSSIREVVGAKSDETITLHGIYDERHGAILFELKKSEDKCDLFIEGKSGN